MSGYPKRKSFSPAAFSIGKQYDGHVMCLVGATSDKTAAGHSAYQRIRNRLEVTE